MGFTVATLWQAPEVNPVNGKARSIPVLNPVNKYGRVFVSISTIVIFSIEISR
jgi:NNP family nitrate/nitrite transporter-like MFS transporter